MAHLKANPADDSTSTIVVVNWSSAIYKTGVIIAYIVPIGIVDRLADLLGILFYITLYKRREYILRNLMHILPGAPPQYRLALRTFTNYLRCLFDFFRLGFISPGDLIGSIQVTGFEQCAAALSHQRGCVLITFHLGNWDYAGSYLAARGISMSALVEELEPEMLKLYTKHRERTGMRTYPIAKSAYAFLDIIKKNRVLALLGDRDMLKNGITVDVMSGKRNIPRSLGPIIARRKLPVLFAYLVLNHAPGRYRYRGHIDPPVFFETVDSFNRALVKKMEEYITAYPDQWFVFQPEWVE